MPVSVPDGCLLVQAGKQLERLTGGHVLAGFHEVRSVDCARCDITHENNSVFSIEGLVLRSHGSPLRSRMLAVAVYRTVGTFACSLMCGLGFA